LNTRELSIFTLAFCMYLVSNYIMTPINNIFGVPSVVLVVGLFLGVLRGKFRYIIYGISILVCIPETYIQYEKDLISTRAMLEIYLRKLNETTTGPPPDVPTVIPVVITIVTVAFYAYFFVILIKYIKNNYKEVFRNLKLVIVILSLPIILSILPIFTMVSLMRYYDLTLVNVFITENMDRLNWIASVTTVIRSIFVVIFGPLYGYIVFRYIGLYKRLGLEA